MVLKKLLLNFVSRTLVRANFGTMLEFWQVIILIIELMIIILARKRLFGTLIGLMLLKIMSRERERGGEGGRGEVEGEYTDTEHTSNSHCLPTRHFFWWLYLCAFHGYL